MNMSLGAIAAAKRRNEMLRVKKKLEKAGAFDKEVSPKEAGIHEDELSILQILAKEDPEVTEVDTEKGKKYSISKQRSN